ncbi:MAG: zinc-dependent peptidase [Rhodobacteraceae bacterium]|nr:zinc-dependent peptidase [Paracoccaceae bacterium]
MTVLAILMVLVAGAFGFWIWSGRQTRSRLLAAELSDEQRAIVGQQVPLTHRLPAELRSRLEGKINLFIDQIEFIGCNGLEVTEEMRLSIAAQACLLVVNTDTWYKNLRTILIYPGAFKSRQSRQSGYVVTEREIVRTGESWARGPVILSWQHAREGAVKDHDGKNVVFHEFAHQIDDLSGHTDGVPNLGKDQSISGWAKAFMEAYQRHVHHVQHGRRTLIDAYGAEGPEEFFAVTVETFFERPAALGREEPEVYEQLSKLFRLDPSKWS